MRRAVTLLFLAAAAAATTCSAEAVDPEAYAGPVQGSGSISPGLGAIPMPQFFTFSGTMTTAIFGDLPVSASGRDLEGSWASGYGTVEVYAPCRATGVFVRAGSDVTVTLAGTTAGDGSGKFVFTPDQLPPSSITSYRLTGEGDIYCRG